MEFLSSLIARSKIWNEFLVVLGGVALLFATSQVEIALQPVPITLQTIGVMLIGLTYTPRRALESHLMWLGLGAVGLPVFSGLAGGFSHVAGPTGGYMIGFVISAFLMALIKEKFLLNSWLSDALLCLMGTGIVFFFGILWLAQFLGFWGALQYGILPFILPGLVKAGLLCSVLQILRHYRQG